MSKNYSIKEALSEGARLLVAELENADREAAVRKADAVKAFAGSCLELAERLYAAAEGPPESGGDLEGGGTSKAVNKKESYKVRLSTMPASSAIGQVQALLSERKMRTKELATALGGTLPDGLEDALRELGYVTNKGWWTTLEDAGIEPEALQVVARLFRTPQGFVESRHRGKVYDALREISPSGSSTHWEYEQIQAMVQYGILVSKYAAVAKGPNFSLVEKAYLPAKA